jgi:metal-dependent amidase/aminoacylase/carboxypeptidase family protein
VRDQVEAAIHRVAAGVAHTFEVEIDVAIPRGNPVTQNTPAERDIAAEAVTGRSAATRRDLAARDDRRGFRLVPGERPGAFVWIGNGPAMAGGNCITPTTITTTRSCPRRRASRSAHSATGQLPLAKRALGE